MKNVFPRDASYMSEFNTKKELDIAPLRTQIVDLERQREKERAQRLKSSTDTCCNSASQVELNATPIDVSLSEFVEPSSDDIDRYLLTVETAAVEELLDELAVAEQQVSPDKITRLMESESMTRDEVLAVLRRLNYSDFNEDVNEVRLTTRRNARIQIRESVNRFLKGEEKEEDKELIEKLKKLPDNVVSEI